MKEHEDKPHNPFAFPLTDTKSFANDGMTLRDYFASKSDIPWNAVIDTLHKKGVLKPTLQDMVEMRVKIKLMEADEFLKQREL